MAKRDKSTRKAPQDNVACPNFMKVAASRGCGGLQAEMERKMEKDSANIDEERTPLNWYFLPDPNDREKFIIQKEKPEKSLEERVYARINEVGATVKRDRREDSAEPGAGKRIIPQDSIIMEDMIMQVSHKRAMEILAEDDMLDENGKIRIDKELPMESKTMQMFIDSYQFAMDRYGAENVIGAYLHLDEYTPHMHLQIVPLECRPVMHLGKVCTNKKDGTIRMKWRLNNSKLFDKDEYTAVWKAYAKALKDYDVVAAEGLVPKGDYEKKASMTPVYEREQEAEEEIKLKKEEAERIDKENQSKIQHGKELQKQNAYLEKESQRISEKNKQLEKEKKNALELVAELITKDTIFTLPEISKAVLQSIVKDDLNSELESYKKEKNGDYILHVTQRNNKYVLKIDNQNGNVFFLKAQNWVLLPKLNGNRFLAFFQVVKNKEMYVSMANGLKEVVTQKAKGATKPNPTQVHRGGGGGGHRPDASKQKSEINMGRGGGIQTPGSSGKEESWDSYDNLTKNRGPKL